MKEGRGDTETGRRGDVFGKQPLDPVTVSPNLRVSASPRPRIPASPNPRVTPSPRKPSFFSVWRNVILGTLLVLAGIGAAVITVMARRTNEPGLTMTAAILSLVIAGLMLIFLVPPLARSARLEILRLDIPFSVTTGGAIFLVIVVVVGFA